MVLGESVQKSSIHGRAGGQGSVAISAAAE